MVSNLGSIRVSCYGERRVKTSYKARPTRTSGQVRERSPEVWIVASMAKSVEISSAP
jgi:hypothetical protein